MARNNFLRAGSRLGKYRIERRLGEGAFATVYRALDTLEGLKVALKVPHPSLLDAETEEDFRKEIRLAARLKHPRILPLKSADIIEGGLVLAYPLGEKTLADRLRTRLSFAVALDYAEQLLEAVAFAHEQRIIHCDIKPENLILLNKQLMLTDFGIAKVAVRTIRASGSGTIGYCAPEQAMGQPSFRSDVFSAGLVIYRMLSGRLPEWPFEWPPQGFDRLRGRVHPELIALLRKSIEVDPRKRFANGNAMLVRFRRLKAKALAKRAKARPAKSSSAAKSHWKSVKWRQFQRAFGKSLQTNCKCGRCGGPVAEAMSFCPWCNCTRSRHDGPTRFPVCCPRCHRGLKADWPYCPWCFGPGFEVGTSREYTDQHYIARCANRKCDRKQLMAFMRYCPWCRRKVSRKWQVPGGDERCSSCGWGIVSEFWQCCPWCGKAASR